MQLDTTNIRSFDGTRIAVQATGTEAGGPTFVLANGLGGSIVAWAPLIRHLSERFRFVSFDYRGLYDSGPPVQPDAVRIVDHREDLLAAMSEMGIESAVLLGWSMGTQVIFDFALNYPEKVDALIPICGTAGDPFRTALRTEQSRWMIPLATEVLERFAGPFGYATRGLAALPFAPAFLKSVGLVADEADLGIFAELAEGFAALDWAVYMRTMREMGFHSAWERLGELSMPTLVVGGRRDIMTPVAVAVAIAEATPGSDLLVFDDGTHYVPIEFPDELNARIDEFVADKLGVSRP